MSKLFMKVLLFTKMHLKYSNFDHKLNYMKQASQKIRRNRQRNIIWFNPTFNKNVKTNIARNFLCLIDKHFPPKHKLHKIFNRNTVKVSYSCMNIVKSIISKHNTRITGRSNPCENQHYFIPIFSIFCFLFYPCRKPILFLTLSYCYHIYKSYIEHIRTLF